VSQTESLLQKETASQRVILRRRKRRSVTQKKKQKKGGETQCGDAAPGGTRAGGSQGLARGCEGVGQAQNQKGGKTMGAVTFFLFAKIGIDKM